MRPNSLVRPTGPALVRVSLAVRSSQPVTPTDSTRRGPPQPNRGPPTKAAPTRKQKPRAPSLRLFMSQGWETTEARSRKQKPRAPSLRLFPVAGVGDHGGQKQKVHPLD